MTPAPVLTGLAPDPRQPGYLLVDVDRGRFASLPADAVEPLRLLVGAELTPVQLARLRDLPPPVRKRRLLAFLVRRGYAGAEVKGLVEELCGGRSTNSLDPAAPPRG